MLASAKQLSILPQQCPLLGRPSISKLQHYRNLRSAIQHRSVLARSNLAYSNSDMFTSAIDKHAQQGLKAVASSSKCSTASHIKEVSRHHSTTVHSTKHQTTDHHKPQAFDSVRNGQRGWTGSGARVSSKLSNVNTSGFESSQPIVIIEDDGPGGHPTTRFATQSQGSIFYDETDFDDDIDLSYIESSKPSALNPRNSSSGLSSSSFQRPSLKTLGTIPTQHPKTLTSSSSPGEPIPWSSSPAPRPQFSSAKHLAQTTVDQRIQKPILVEDEMDAIEGPPTKRLRRKLPWSPRKEVRPTRTEEIGADQSRAGSSLEQSTPKSKLGPNLHMWNQTASAVKQEQGRLRQKNLKGARGKAQQDLTPFETSKKKQSVPPTMLLSDEQKYVLDKVVGSKAKRGENVFFTGSAGTGKSVLLRRLITELKKKYRNEGEAVAVTASTGLAACNIEGITLHSFSGIGLGKESADELVKKIKKNPKARQRWMRAKVLIIDEVSMVDGDLFDKLEFIGRKIRSSAGPFGGLQLVITGDFFQLPPVPDRQKPTKFAFQANSWGTSINHTIGLTQVFRQKDPIFANILNEMRLGKISNECISLFKGLERPINYDDGLDATELFSTRNEVDAANSARISRLTGEEHSFAALDTGTANPDAREKILSNCMAPPVVKLKKGAQVMLIKNLDESLVNGSLGKVVGFMDEGTFEIYGTDEASFMASVSNATDNPEDGSLQQKLKAAKELAKGGRANLYPLVRFTLADGTTRDLLCQPESWKFELPNGEVQASRTQVPLILAWALSIHKAQGQTLERVKVNLGRVFEKGQAYVALSRATTQDGLQVLGFDARKVMAHPDVRVFYDNLYNHTNDGGGLQADYEGGFLGDEQEEAYEPRSMYG